jgi:hypothetical protein
MAIVNAEMMAAEPYRGCEGCDESSARFGALRA